MTIEQRTFDEQSGWRTAAAMTDPDQAQLVLVFGNRILLEHEQWYAELRSFYPYASIIHCSTAGEIVGTRVHDRTIAATAVRFSGTRCIVHELSVGHVADSYALGHSLATMFDQPGLSYVMLLSDGQRVNGSELVRGFNGVLPEHVSVSGGLAGDDARFERTVVGLNGRMLDGNVVAIGFYGPGLVVRHGTYGGWDSFGVDRVITKATENILYELDGQPALDLYKKYLGERSAELPGAALLFPLSIRTGEQDTPVVRTILSIDEEQKAMIFAGNMPVGAYARLMKSNHDRLIDGSGRAAELSAAVDDHGPQLALLISCVGRKMVLGQRVEEEAERVREVFGEQTVLTGFYSYGEISPHHPMVRCDLHNQTMTITTFTER